MMNLFTFFGRIYLKATTVIVSLLTKTQAERLPRAASMNACGDRVKTNLIVAREISSVREQISIQRSPARGIIRSLRNLSECEPRGIANRMPQ
jgi:hypothetical protein